MNFCPECGARVSGHRFCSQCGAELGAPSAAPDGGRETQQLPVAGGYAGQADWQGAYAPEGEQEARRSRVAAVLVGVAVVVVAAVVFAVWQLTRSPEPPTTVAAPATSASTAPSSSASPATTASPASTAPTTSSPTPTATVTKTVTASPSVDPAALAAARKIDALLSESAGQRALVVGAVTCRADPDQAARDLDEALMGRDRLLGRVDDMPFSRLPRGGEMSEELANAWLLSKYADQNFLDWASEWRDTGRCDTTGEAYRAAVAQSETAQRHKRAFAALWEKNVRAPMKLSTKRTAANI